MSMVPEHREEVHVLQLVTWQRPYVFLLLKELAKMRVQQCRDENAHFVDMPKQALCVVDAVRGIVCDLLRGWKILALQVKSSG